MKRIFQSRIALAALFVCVFLAVFVMTSLTPMLADDFSYSFSYAEAGKRIETLRDAAASLRAHYHSMNGRMISHGLAMLFLLAPKPLFNVCNALNACLLLWMLFRFVSGERRELLLCLLAAFLIWTFTPVFGQSYLWLDGSLNYSWAVCAQLLFLFPYFCEYRGREYRLKASAVGRLAFLLLAFAAGAYSENASSAGIFIAFCFLALTWKKRRPPLYLCLGFCVACAGFLFMILAPAEKTRAAQWDWLTLARNVQRVFEAPQQTLLWLYILFAVLLTLSVMRGADRGLLASALVFFLGSLVSIAVFVFAYYFPWRSLCCTTVYLVLACLLLLQGLRETGLRWPVPVLTAALAVSFVFSFVLGLGDILVLSLEGRQRDALLRQAAREGTACVEVRQYSSNTKYAASYLLPDVYEESWRWPNYDIARYYGVEAVVGLPPAEEFGADAAS